MQRGLFLGLLLFAALFHFGLSVPNPNFPTSVSARFALPCQGTDQYDPTPGNQCVQIPSTQQNSYLSSSIIITWGTGANPAYTSALQFLPYQNVPLGLTSANALPIGKLTHYNYPINCYSNCAQYIPTLFNFNLSLTVNATATSQIHYTASYVMNLDETPNIDGTINGICPYQNDTTWKTYNAPYGYNKTFPCCPYYTTPASPNPDPNGAFSSINGPCSDKIQFTTNTVPGTFTIAGTSYTLTIMGISNSSTIPPGANNNITFFISQEYQLQVGYIWAFVSRQCNSSVGCNDNNQCTTDSCLSGICSNAPKTGGSCTDAANYSPGFCINYKCASGICTGSNRNNLGSCSTSATLPSSYTSDCAARLCSNGQCQWLPKFTSNNCTSATPHEAQCQKATCTNGACKVTSKNQGFTCTPWSSSMQSAISNQPQCNKATCNGGTCTFSSISGSCQTGLSVAPVCKARTCVSTSSFGFSGAAACSYTNMGGSCSSTLGWSECKSRVCSSGTCGYSANVAQGSCTTVLSPKQCYQRLCTSASGGVCGYNGINGGSCTGVTAKSCKKRSCSSGSCVYSNNDGGSCTQSSSGSTLGVQFCNIRKCASGSCIYSYDSNQATMSSGSCTGLSWAACVKRVCHSTTKNPPGSCGYVNVDGGSCSQSFSGVATGVSQCNARVCKSGTCRYSYQAWSGASGSCTTLTWQVCNSRTCHNKHSSVSTSTSPLGSCGYVAISGSCASSLSFADCKKRVCNNGACSYSANSGQGSCTSISPSLCNLRTCSGTACVLSYQSQGSCGQTSLSVKECNVRSCKSVSGNKGSCGYVSAFGGNTCTGTFTSSQVSGFFSTCYTKACSNGACAISYVSGTCNTNTLTSNDYTCFKQTCQQSTQNGLTGGVCNTAFSSGSCHGGLTARPCSSRLCNSGGQCVQSVAGYGTGVRCTDSTKGVTGSFCSPQYCTGAGSCANKPSIKEGSPCLSVSGNAAGCVSSACRSGTCLDTSDVANFNNTLQCANPLPTDTKCVGYYCQYHSASRFNHQGTCVRMGNPSALGTPCTIPGNTDSAMDQACYTLTCNASGACAKFFHADNTYCGTPSNAQLSNGFGCSQFVCKSGSCNINQAQPIADYSQCAGVQPCDPASPGCLIECQKFICLGGICQLDNFREGQNCSFIKYLTARDGSMVERDSESGSGTSNGCAVGICTKGVCLAQNAQNGTACGNRTKYSDLCYGDFCNDQGQCITTGRRNCLGVLPLPSICWDTTCEASTGDCVIVSSGVVDCSCIDDCSACTAAYDATNRNSTTSRTLSCYWCTGSSDTGFPPGCYDRMVPGSNVVLPPPTRAGTCYTDNSPCGGGAGLTGGQVAGIVLGVVGLSSLAALVVAVAALLVRYFAAAGVPPANASLTDLAFDKNVKNNVFYEGANLSNFSALYAEPKFITT